MLRPLCAIHLSFLRCEKHFYLSTRSTNVPKCEPESARAWGVKTSSQFFPESIYGYVTR